MRVCVSVSLVLEVARARVLLRAWRTLLYSRNERDDRVTTNQADDLRAPLEKWGGNFICMGLCQLRDGETVERGKQRQ